VIGSSPDRRPPSTHDAIRNVTQPPAPCPVCRSIVDGFSAPIIGAKHWLLRPHPAPSPIAGWSILDLRRHAEGWDALEAPEAAELGPVVRAASAAIRSITGCDRVYLLGFAEAVRHVHLHLVPRHGAEPRSTSWSVADLYREIAEGRSAPADVHHCKELARHIADALDLRTDHPARD